MKSLKFIKLIILAQAALAIVLNADLARGQSLGLSPAYVDAHVKSGRTYNQSFSISNNTGVRLRLRCSAGDFWYDESNRRVEGRAGTLPRSASPWVQFSPAELVVEPNSAATVNAVISVPEGANGGYYTAPTFELEAEENTAPGAKSGGTASASIAYSMSGLLMLTTEGTTEYGVEIMGGQVAPPTAASPLELRLDVRNRSTAHVRPRGVFAILNGRGALAGRGRIGEKRFMPGQRDVLTTLWAGDLPPGTYTAVITLTYDRVGMEPSTLVYEKSFVVRP